MLLEDGVANGGGGCNRWSADYQIDGGALAFGPVLSTRMACPDPAMEIEHAFFERLGSATAWVSDGASLALLDGDGSELARFSQTRLD
jgi:heat shock protein HslJ